MGERRDATWRRITARTSWIKRNSRGRSGEELRTALFLEEDLEGARDRTQYAHTKTI